MKRYANIPVGIDAAAVQQIARPGDLWVNAQIARSYIDEIVRLEDALAEIASMPEVQRNPDGVDQAAATMKLVAREAIGDVIATERKLP